jgi:hypothetical protein
MNGHTYVASLRYEYIIPPENKGTKSNPDYYYMRDERQEEQGPLLDVDREGIRTWVFAAKSVKTHQTYQLEPVPFAFMEDELYRLPLQGVTTQAQQGFWPGKMGADAMVSHPYTNPLAETEELGLSYGTTGTDIRQCYSAIYFQHILLQVEDKDAPNGQYIARDEASPQLVSPDAAWPGTAPTDRRKLVNFWYSGSVNSDGNVLVYTKPAKYYNPDGTPDTYRNGAEGYPSTWNGDLYYKDKGVLPADKCGIGFQSKSFSQGAWPSEEFAFLDGNEETGAGTWYYQKEYDPGRPLVFNILQGEDVSAFGIPVEPQQGTDNGLGNAIVNIGRAYGFVFNDKEEPKRADGSNYYDYDENGEPTSWTDEDGNVNQGTPIENGDGTYDWEYRNESGDEVGKPTDDNGDEVEPHKDKWTRITEGYGSGVFPPRLIGVCYTRKEDPQNVWAPIFKPCTDNPVDENGDEIFEYNEDGTVTGWLDDAGNQNYVVTNGDGTYTGFDSNGDEVDLPNDEPYGSPDFYKYYTETVPAYPPDNKPWLRELYFYFEYNHGVYGDRTVEVEIEITKSLQSWNIRELPVWNSTVPVLFMTGTIPPYVYVWKFVPWRMAGEVELGFCEKGGFRSGRWKKVQYYYYDNVLNQTLPVPYSPSYPNYGYVWDYEPGTDCFPYNNPEKITKKTVKKSFKVTADSYASFQFYQNLGGQNLPKNTNHIYDGAPQPGTGFCKFYLDIHEAATADDTTYTWRLSKVSFPEGV